MARARNIKPGFFQNEDLVELPFEVRLLFIGLWTLADREGRLEDRPKRIKMAVFPADNVDVDAALEQLKGAGFLVRYDAGNIKAIQITNFSKHQNPHVKEAASTIPPADGFVPQTEQAPDEHGASTVQAPDEHEASHADSLIPCNPIPITESVNRLTSGTPAGIVCARLKSECRITQGLNPQNPKLIALLEAGLTADEIVAAGMDAKVKTFAYVLAAAEGRRRDADSVTALPSARASPRMSHADASKLAAARAIFGTEIEGNQHGKSTSRVIDITPTTARLMGG
jgi:hypothetical protein